MVFRIALQFYGGVVFNGAVQHAGRHGNLGAGFAVHLIGFPGDRMVQAIHMGIGGQGHIPPGNRFAVFYLRSRARGFQDHARRHGYQGRVAGIHNPNTGAGRHVFLGFGKSLFQALQLAAICHAAEGKLVFEQAGNLAGVGRPSQLPFDPFRVASVIFVAFPIAVGGFDTQPGNLVFRAGLYGFRLYGASDLNIGGGIIIDHGNAGGGKGFVHAGHAC